MTFYKFTSCFAFSAYVTSSTSTSYLFELLQVLVQLQIVQDDGDKKTQQDLKCDTRTRVRLRAVQKKPKKKQKNTSNHVNVKSAD